MSKVRILWRNRADYADVSASSQDSTDYAASYVQNPLRARKWLTGATLTDEWLKFDLYEALDIECVILYDHDLSQLDTDIYVDGDSASSFDSGAGGAPEFSQALTWDLDAMVAFFPAAKSYRHWRVRFTKDAASYQRTIGRVYLGDYYEPDQNADAFVDEPVDLSVTTRAIDGSTWSEIRGLYRHWEMTFPAVPQAQYEEFRDIEHTVGTHTPLFLVRNWAIEGTDGLIYGKLSRLRGGRTVGVPVDADGYRWNVELRIDEEV